MGDIKSIMLTFGSPSVVYTMFFLLFCGSIKDNM